MLDIFKNNFVLEKQDAYKRIVKMFNITRFYDMNFKINLESLKITRKKSDSKFYGCYKPYCNEIVLPKYKIINQYVLAHELLHLSSCWQSGLPNYYEIGIENKVYGKGFDEGMTEYINGTYVYPNNYSPVYYIEKYVIDNLVYLTNADILDYYFKADYYNFIMYFKDKSMNIAGLIRKLDIYTKYRHSTDIEGSKVILDSILEDIVSLYDKKNMGRECALDLINNSMFKSNYVNPEFLCKGYEIILKNEVEKKLELRR